MTAGKVRAARKLRLLLTSLTFLLKLSIISKLEHGIDHLPHLVLRLKKE
jgi:hypothetical protein